jgi:uncharacterized protein with GYD domain
MSGCPDVPVRRSRIARTGAGGGTSVLKFVMKFTYSNASWARILKAPEDRTSSVAALMEHFSGSLESIYWEVETASAFVVVDLPDSVSAAAVIATTTKTGAFKDVNVHEVLTQDQLEDVVALAKSSDDVYYPPGWLRAEPDA